MCKCASYLPHRSRVLPEARVESSKEGLCIMYVLWDVCVACVVCIYKNVEYVGQIDYYEIYRY